MVTALCAENGVTELWSAVGKTRTRELDGVEEQWHGEEEGLQQDARQTMS